MHKDVPGCVSVMAECGSSESRVLLMVCMSTQTSRPLLLQKRLVVHAAVILDVSSKLPRTVQSTHISRQLLRSGTGAAANYGEARAAESRSDFVHKLRIVLKERNETAVWLQLILESSL